MGGCGRLGAARACAGRQHPGAAADESAAERTGASVGPEGPYGALKLNLGRPAHRSECRPGGPYGALKLNLGRAQRTGASVGPEGRTERSN